MARDFAKRFYASKEWANVRQCVLMRDGYMCRDCHIHSAQEVHHITHLTEKNIDDPNVALNPDNLISLCRDCHFKRHEDDKRNGHVRKEVEPPTYVFNEYGVPVAIPPTQKGGTGA